MSTGEAFSAARAVLDKAVSDDLTPGAAAIVARGADVLAEIYTGTLGLEGDADMPVGPHTIYDLSSLTKPLATAASIMTLVAEGVIDLDAQVIDFFRSFSQTGPGHDKARVTVRHLLGHSSGLPAWLPFHEAVAEIQKVREATGAVAPPLFGTEQGKRAVYRLADAAQLQAQPGTRALYSDVGYIVLGRIVELVTKHPLHEYARTRIFQPLRLRETSFVPLVPSRDPDAAASLTVSKHVDGVIDPDVTAPCGHSIGRGTPVRGFVHDDNAYAMGGVAGHAGLFATVRDVHGLTAEFVGAEKDNGRVLRGEVVRACFDTSNRPPGATWLLGWDTPSVAGSTAGTKISASAVGHLGFTGTSVWIDRERGVHVVLLTNRVHRDTAREKFNELRVQFHDAVFAEV